MNKRESASVREFKGGPGARRWPLFVIGLLLTQAVGLGVMITIAVADPSVAVEPNYYEKAVSWDNTAASRAVADRLGWRADVGVGPLSGPDRELHVALTGRDGAVTEARVHVELFHQARSKDRLEADLKGMGGGGYVTRLPILRPGLWEVRLTISHGHDVATMTQTLDVPARL